ncbi:hypothetical protein [Pedobacter frigiditerrae]|uniref:hypothetical protein n=1 Tax=Pedobacter frigiditerrae TaxID=2530452 RepID=UPI0029304512|nr:hypothetical protein [Pedobacter frigiditerrae]
MTEENSMLSQEELKKKAYLEGLKLSKSGMDREIIYARLEKQGIPEEIIESVIQNLFIQQKKEKIDHLTPFYNVALFRIGIGLAAAAIFYLLSPNQFYIPIGLIGGGILSAFLIKKDMK